MSVEIRKPHIGWGLELYVGAFRLTVNYAGRYKYRFSSGRVEWELSLWRMWPDGRGRCFFDFGPGVIPF